MRKHERRASRLDALLCNILGISTVAIFILSCAGTFVTKLHMFQQALTKRRKHYEDNMWLEEQCNQAEFYQKMKHHSTICLWAPGWARAHGQRGAKPLSKCVICQHNRQRSNYKD